MRELKNSSKGLVRHVILSSWLKAKCPAYAYVFKFDGKMNVIIGEKELIDDAALDLLEATFNSEIWVIFLDNYLNKTKLHYAVTVVFGRIEGKYRDYCGKRDGQLIREEAKKWKYVE